MNSDSIREPSIDARRRFVDVTSTKIDEADGEGTDARLVEATGDAKLITQGTFEPIAAVNPDVIGSVDKNVRDRWVRYQRRELGEFGRIPAGTPRSRPSLCLCLCLCLCCSAYPD